MNELTVRVAPLEELPRIAALKKQIHDVHVKGRPDLFNPIANLAAFAQHAETKNCTLLLAERHGEPTGYALVNLMDRPANPYMRNHRFLHVEEFCVDEKCQRQGVGSALMDAVREYARSQDCSRIALDVWAFNEGAKQFYEAVGMHSYRYFMEMDLSS